MGSRTQSQERESERKNKGENFRIPEFQQNMLLFKVEVNSLARVVESLNCAPENQLELRKRTVDCD